MFANYLPKGLLASFISRNTSIVALEFIPQFPLLFSLSILSLFRCVFFKLFTLISHASSLQLSFLVLRSRYLTLCLHFSSVLLLLIRLLLSCSLSPFGLHGGYAGLHILCVCVWVSLRACALPWMSKHIGCLAITKAPHCDVVWMVFPDLISSQLTRWSLDTAEHNHPPLYLHLIISHS